MYNLRHCLQKIFYFFLISCEKRKRNAEPVQKWDINNGLPWVTSQRQQSLIFDSDHRIVSLDSQIVQQKLIPGKLDFPKHYSRIEFIDITFWFVCSRQNTLKIDLKHHWLSSKQIMANYWHHSTKIVMKWYLQ